MNCPVCGSTQTTSVYSVAAAPVTCTAVFDDAVQARAVPSGPIDLAVCAGCGLAFNQAWNPELAEQGAALDVGYETSQAASRHFSQFARHLAANWVQRYDLRGQTVIEVGAGGGDFLRELIHAGVAQVTAIDPMTPPDCAHIQISVRREWFGAMHHDCPGQALICRHTLEHIPQVSVFLRAVHAWAAYAPERVVLFELPSAERIIEEAAFWDVYYEHCNYFTEATLRAAFVQAGFELRRLENVYDGQYWIVEAVAAPSSLVSVDVAREQQRWQTFGSQAQAAAARVRTALRRLSADGPVVLWQGAAKTVGVLAASEATDAITCAVDLSPGRRNKFLPGSGLAVYAPEVLSTIQPRHIVLMNPVYYDEVHRQLQALEVRGHLWTMNELTLAQEGALP